MDTPSPRFVAVRYVGNKPVKTDNVLRRNIQWMGKGDVQFVPIEDALIYCRFKDVWEHAKDVEMPTDGTPFPEAPVRPVLPPEAAARAESLTVDAEDLTSVPPAMTPEEMASHVQDIIRAIPKLKRADFSENGKPKLPALKAILGRQVYAVERDAAWDALSQALRDDQQQAASTGG